MSGVEDRVIVVTGAGRGLGRAYAEYLASEGARVVVNDIGTSLTGDGTNDQSVADEVVEAIRDRGGQAVVSRASVAEPAGAEKIVDDALKAFGRVDGVVNNAGILRDRSFHKMSDAEWDAVIQTHLYGTYLVTSRAWRLFREQAHGRVVVATSSTGLFGNFGQANYGAAKLGVVGLIHTLAVEGKKHGILANAVSPMGATRMTSSGLNDELKRQLDPLRVAPAVAHLCSDECTDNGVIIRAGRGHFSRVALMSSPGVDFDGVPELTAFQQRWSAITDMTGATLGGGVGEF